MLQHVHVYPLSTSQLFAELCRGLLSQETTSTFVCYTQCTTPDKAEKPPPRHPNQSRLITPTRSHLILQGCGNKLHVMQQIIQNQTKAPAQPNTRTGKSSHVGPGSWITPATYRLRQVPGTVQSALPLYQQPRLWESVLKFLTRSGAKIWPILGQITANSSNFVLMGFVTLAYLRLWK